MAESASAFFAKKKKGKKPIKSFNANKLDASSISLGVGGQNGDNNEMNSSAAGATDNFSSNTKTISSQSNTIINDEWEDATPYGSTTTAATNNKTSGTSELLDMRALQQKRLEQDDVAERLRIEETKAALQKAKQGMEREAKRLEEERAAAAAKASSSTTSRFAGATTTTPPVTTTTVGDKWIPPNKRGLTPTMPRATPEQKGSSMFHYQRKLDVQDEEAFPDLASADKLLSEAKEKAIYRPKKPTSMPTEKKERSMEVLVADPTTPPLPKQQDEGISVEKTPVETKVEEPEVAVSITSNTEESATAGEINATPEAIAPAEEKISSTATEEGSNAALLKKKKKKKDVSSFKVGG